MTRWIFGAMALLVGAAAPQDDGPKEPLCRAPWNSDIEGVRLLLTCGAAGAKE